MSHPVSRTARTSHTARRTAVCLSLSALMLAGLAGCDRRTDTTGTGTGTTTGTGTGTTTGTGTSSTTTTTTSPAASAASR